jgi:hypothetical protein
MNDTPTVSPDVRETLEAADSALRDQACHGGPNVRCLRSPDQCRESCGREAGDALLLVEAALAKLSPPVDPDIGEARLVDQAETAWNAWSYGTQCCHKDVFLAGYRAALRGRELRSLEQEEGR